MRKPAKIRFFPGMKPPYIIGNEGSGEIEPETPAAEYEFNLTVGKGAGEIYGYVPVDYGDLSPTTIDGQTIASVTCNATGNAVFNVPALSGADTGLSISFEGYSGNPITYANGTTLYFASGQTALTTFLTAENGNTLKMYVDKIP